ncbi:MAG: hypothetical protein EHM88_24145 [Candidatus Rokuibacteriota bacterium]|nr:MAG: hypothetical protein EHM88_24145 [Candidatus Rokubacteria bacterium]
MAIATLALASAALTAGLGGLRSRTGRVIAALTVVSTIVLVQAPPLADMLHLEPLHPMDWGVAVAGSGLAALLLRLLGPSTRPGGVSRAGRAASA